MSKRWKQDKNANQETHALLYEPFGEEEKLAKIYRDSDGDWHFVSSKHYLDDEMLFSNDLEGAKTEAVEILINYFADEAEYYTQLKKALEETNG